MHVLIGIKGLNFHWVGIVLIGMYAFNAFGIGDMEMENIKSFTACTCKPGGNSLNYI